MIIRLDGINPEDRQKALAMADQMANNVDTPTGARNGHGFWSSSDPDKTFYVWKTKTGVTVRGVYK